MMSYSNCPPIKSIGSLITCTFLAACGGAGDGGGGAAQNQVEDVVLPPAEPSRPTIPSVRFMSAGTSDTTPLGVIAINVSNNTTRGFVGNLNQNQETIEGGLLAGTFDQDRTRVNLTNGGSVALIALTSNTYARSFATSGLSDDLFGVVGQATNLSEMPDMGSSTYNGRVSLQADNGDATFALSGQAVVSVGWGPANDVDTVFRDLDGRKNDTQNVTDIGTVTISNATISGTGFSGGIFTTTGSDLAYAGGGQRVHEGQFFGPNASEVGGVVGLTSSELELSAVFSASR